MFRMEFQTLDAVEENDDLSRTHKNDGGRGKSVYEKFQHKAVEHKASPPKIFEGRVNRVGKLQRTVSSNDALPGRSCLPQVLTCSASIPENWVQMDLLDFGFSKAVEEPITVDPEVLRELVKPFAESVNLTHQPSGKRIDSDVFVTFLEYQSGRSLDLLSDGVGYGSFRNVESLQTRSSSMHSNGSISWSDSSDAEGSSFYVDRLHIKDEEKASPAARAYNRAFNKLMHKKNKPAIPDVKSAKPWEEPLLASHEQVKLQRKVQKEAKFEAKRLAEEAKKEAEIRERELLNLPKPLPESAQKSQEQYTMRKGIHKLFRVSSGSPKEGLVDARESKLVMRRASMFETCISPSATDVALSHVRPARRPAARRDIHFATVESNQRDVEAWTKEEYMAKNARLPECSARENDEEFGGIEGNQLLNQYFDNDVTDNLDSDSDSD